MLVLGADSASIIRSSKISNAIAPDSFEVDQCGGTVNYLLNFLYWLTMRLLCAHIFYCQIESLFYFFAG